MNEPFVHKLMVRKENSETSVLPMKPVEEQIWLAEKGLTGDEAANPNHQRGKDQAIFAYPIQHYTYWKKVAEVENVDVGSFGENFSVLEMDEHSVCIGDIYRFGDAVIQVSQPFQPYKRLGERIKHKDIATQMNQTGRLGWYFRVLEEGYVLSRIDLELVERPYPEWSIAACQEISLAPIDNLRRTRALLACDALAQSWRRRLRKKVFGKA